MQGLTLFQNRLKPFKITSFILNRAFLFMQSQPNWQKVFTTRFYTEAEIIRGKLEENEIPVHLLNKQDTMYNVALGEIEIYVPAVLKEMALALLSKTLEN
jgi:hypothetical protein